MALEPNNNQISQVARFVIDRDGKVVEWDSGAQSIYGWSSDDAIGRRLSELIIPERHRAAHEAGMKRFSATRQGAFVGKTLEITSLHRDGHEFPAEITISIEQNGDDYRFVNFARLPAAKP